MAEEIIKLPLEIVPRGEHDLLYSIVRATRGEGDTGIVRFGLEHSHRGEQVLLWNWLLSIQSSPPPPFVGYLDAYTANIPGAWSAARRVLASYTGPLIRVRRSSDNAEQNIEALPDGSLDEASLLAFAGAGDAFGTTVYDQKELVNFTQPSASAQPKIVDAGVVILSGDRPCFLFDGVDDKLQANITLPQPLSIHSLWADQETSNFSVMLGRTGNIFGIGIDPSANLYLYGTGGFARPIVRTQNLVCDQFVASGAASKIRRGGVQLGATDSTNGELGDTIFISHNGGASIDNTKWCELAVFDRILTDAEMDDLYAKSSDYYTL